MDMAVVFDLLPGLFIELSLLTHGRFPIHCAV